MTKKIIGAALGLGILFGLCGFVYALTNNKISVGYNENYEPVQPIPYSHQLHAGKLGIDCKYCHTTAETSRHASVPSLNICMNCHMQVRQVGGKDSPHIAKLIEAYENNTPIQWKKVHLLPDHVKFNHASHVKKGKACQECHGPIEEMEIVKQYQTLSMGWCVNCHRQPENNASINCGTCHY
jgi:Cytochrome c7 and related cytochrome c